MGIKYTMDSCRGCRRCKSGQKNEYVCDQCMKNSKKEFAFWSYDQFPFVLGGEIDEILDDGRVTIKSYGKGYSFRPISIVSSEDGLKIEKFLQKLDHEYRITNESVFQGFYSRLTKGIPFKIVH